MGPRASFEQQNFKEDLTKYTELECLLGQMETDTYKDPQVQAKWISYLSRQPVRVHGMQVMRPMLTAVIRGDL